MRFVTLTWVGDAQLVFVCSLFNRSKMLLLCTVAVPVGWPGATGHPLDSEVNDDEVAEVSRKLLDDVIPSFVAELDSMTRLPCDSHELSAEMHAAGINMRYLGRIASLTKLPHVRELAEIEMIARVAKHVLIVRVFRLVMVSTLAGCASLVLCVQAPLRKLMDSLPSKETTAFLNPSAAYAAQSHIMVAKREVQGVIIDFLNLLLGTGPKSDEYWRQIIEPCVQSIFSYSFGGATPASSSSVRSGEAGGDGRLLLHKPQLLLAVQHACGIRVPLVRLVGPRGGVALLRPSHPSVTPTNIFAAPQPFSVADLAPVKPAVKSMRTACGSQPPECFGLAEPAETHFARKDFQSALQAYNLRLALLQSQGDGFSPVAADTVLAIAKTLIQLVGGG
jgi:hypothetical protein